MTDRCCYQSKVRTEREIELPATRQPILNVFQPPPASVTAVDADQFSRARHIDGRYRQSATHPAPRDRPITPRNIPRFPAPSQDPHLLRNGWVFFIIYPPYPFTYPYKGSVLHYFTRDEDLVTTIGFYWDFP